MSVKTYKAKLNKFIELCKEQVNFNDFTAQEKDEFEENAIAIFSSNHLADGAITKNVVDFFLFLINPRSMSAVEAFYKERGESGPYLSQPPVAKRKESQNAQSRALHECVSAK